MYVLLIIISKFQLKYLVISGDINVIYVNLLLYTVYLNETTTLKLTVKHEQPFLSNSIVPKILNINVCMSTRNFLTTKMLSCLCNSTEIRGTSIFIATLLQ